ncbi:MAG: VWA domain-containing protein [Saprospiraceae bacterium]|nr:VWA domain-containing protein [Saprospiraceae bacterium]
MKKITKILLFLSLFAPIILFAQKKNNTFSINNVMLNDMTKRIEAKALILDENKKRPELINRSFIVTEEVNGERERLTIDRIKPLDNRMFRKDTFTVLFLVDVSGSMKTDDRITKARNAVVESIEEIEFSPSSKVFISTFANEISPLIEVNKDNIRGESSIIEIPKTGADTDLYRALSNKINEINKLPGTKVFILLSDGVDDTKKNPFYQNNPRLTPENVFKLCESLNDQYMIFPIGLGGGVDSTFLANIPLKTNNKEDYYIPTYDPNELKEIFINIFSYFTTNAIFYIIPDEGKYRGEKRNLRIEWRNGGISAKKDYKKGTIDAPYEYGQRKLNWLDWLLQFVIGTLIVGLIYLGLRYIIPLYKRKMFKKLFVQKYVPETNVIRKDPLTQDPFEEGDMVVVKCKQMVSLSTWDAIGHCPNYPGCMEYNNPCDGAGASETAGDFFSQRGIFKTFNWIFYGALGGFIGWILFAIKNLLKVRFHFDIIKSFFNLETVQNKLKDWKGSEQLLNNVKAVSDEVIVGIVIATGIIAALSFVEEKGESRKFSIIRVIARIIIGFILACFVFFYGALNQYLIFNGDVLLSGITNWLIFGIFLGIILSLWSSIIFYRGIFASVIACFVGFIVYHFLLILLPDAWSKLISFIVLGALLGGIIVSVISSLEDFEIKYLSPQQYWGVVKPISKWLRRGLEVWIGTEPKCYIFIKWEDELAKPMHAKLTLENDRVYIEPKFDTLLNGVLLPINAKTPLNNNDILQLGVGSVSKMQYMEKRKTK